MRLQNLTTKSLALAVAECREARKIIRIKLPKPKPSGEKRVTKTGTLIDSLTPGQAKSILDAITEILGGIKQ